MAKMVNISDVTLNVKVSMGPRQDPMVTTLEPGEGAQFPDGYCVPVQSAGVEVLPCVLSRANSHLGIPALVPEAEAEAARTRYLKVKAAQELKSKDPAAVIRRLEAELAVAKARAEDHKIQAAAAMTRRPVTAEPLHATASGPGPDALADATTPKPPKAKRQRKSRAKPKPAGAQG